MQSARMLSYFKMMEAAYQDVSMENSLTTLLVLHVTQLVPPARTPLTV